MARGRKTSFTIHLTPAQRQTLLAWQRATNIPAGLARRARIVLLLAGGVTSTDIATTVGMSRRHTYKWIQRFIQAGLEGLQEKPGRGRRIERGCVPRLTTSGIPKSGSFTTTLVFTSAASVLSTRNRLIHKTTHRLIGFMVCLLSEIGHRHKRHPKQCNLPGKSRA